METVRFLELPKEWAPSVRLLLPEIGVACAENGVPVKVCRGKGLALTRTEEGITLTAERQQDFSRALSHLPALLSGRKTEISEKCTATTLCLMAECSRNAVMNLPFAKLYLRRLALMGYDSMMLYTEDTYELPDYPYFGRQRGRYTMDELKELDDYAFSLGIELIPCIQTLGHLERALQWKAFDAVKDTSDILLVGEEKTYALIDEMLRVCRSCFRSHRINLGLDEAHTLGRGQYMDLHGARKTSDIMLEHIARVNEICRRYDFAPMMWSDMFFRMAFNGAYYVWEGEISKEVMDKVPEGVTLIYWDYYSCEPQRARFSHMIDCHLKFPHNKTAFAGGAWGWSGFAPHLRFSLKASRMQLDECRKRGMTDLIVTTWGSNGAEGALAIALPILLDFAEESYTGGVPTDEEMEARSRELFGIGFEEFFALDAPDEMAHKNDTEPVHPRNPSKYLLYNDPLEGLLDAHLDPLHVAEDYRAAEAKLLPLCNHPVFGYLYDTLAHLSRVLSRKADFTVRLRNAYLSGNRETMTAMAQELPLIVKDTEALLTAFRRQWMKENKPQGFISHDLRIGGLIQRLKSAELRICEYLDGKVENIPELEEPVLSFGAKYGGENTPYVEQNNWTRNVTTCIL